MLRQLLSRQLAKSVVVEDDAFAGAGAFNGFFEVGDGTVGAADRIVSNPGDDPLELLLVPGATTGVGWR